MRGTREGRGIGAGRDPGYGRFRVALLFPAVAVLAAALAMGAVSFPPASSAAGGKGSAGFSTPAPNTKERCPVCGMFVAKFPDFLSVVVFRDGSRLYFDGVKDFFKFWFDPKRYVPKRKREDVEDILVKDYYDLAFIDGRKAFYVAGSNVFGPMGRELVPFSAEADAREFMVDHAGKFLYRLDEVTPLVLQVLD
jgi:nitrous oxide reductase accessory protein NosL